MCVMRILAIDPGTKSCGYAVVEMLENGSYQYIKGGNVDSLVSVLSLLMDAFSNVDRVAIERVGLVFRVNARHHLAQTAEVAGIAYALAWVRFKDSNSIVMMTSREWRKTLLGTGKLGSKASMQDAAIKEAVQARVSGLPGRTNVHIRDAVGLAIAASKR